MSMLDDLSKVLPIGEIYKDLLQPTTQQIGQGLEAVAKTSRFVLTPFEYLGSLHDRYLNFLKRISEKTKEQELIEVHPKITGPVLEGIKYLEEDSILFEMFVELLSKVVTKKNAAKAHPAFIQIINQLSPDEALILTYLKRNSYEYWEQADLNNRDRRFYNNRVIRNDFPVKVLQFSENYTMYINHLANLEIAGIPEYRNQEPIFNDNTQIGVKIFRRTIFLDFGRLFSECCIPDKIENDQKEGKSI
jgi:hypothetical protein